MPRKSKIQIKVKRFKRKFFHLIKNNKLYIVIFFAFILFILWIKIFYNKYVNNPQNIVKNIYFEKQILDNNNLDTLIKNTIEVFSGTNTAKNKILWYQREKNQILKKFPYIKNIKVDVLSKNTLKIDYSFEKPKLILVWSWEIFAVYWDKDYIQKYNQNFLTWLNLNIPEQINLPSYIDTSNNLKLIFWRNSSTKLINYIKKIRKEFPKWILFYIVWWENIKVLTQKKTIYFSLEKDIDKQISQLDLIKEQKPKLYSWASEIDIGNLDEWGYFKVIK